MLEVDRKDFLEALFGWSIVLAILASIIFLFVKFVQLIKWANKTEEEQMRELPRTMTKSEWKELNRAWRGIDGAFTQSEKNDTRRRQNGNFTLGERLTGNTELSIDEMAYNPLIATPEQAEAMRAEEAEQERRRLKREARKARKEEARRLREEEAKNQEEGKK